MEPDDGPEGFEEEGPLFSWLPPDDRLWRHPSEVHGNVPPPSAGLPGAALPGPEKPSGHRSSKSILAAARPSRTWTVVMVAGMIGALAASGIGMVTGAFVHDPTVVSSFGPSTVVALTPTPGAPVNWSTVDNEIAPTVVSIVVAGAGGAATGSGLLIYEAGKTAYIVTSNSILSNGGQIQVTFPAGQTVSARLVGNDNLSGLAVLAVPKNPDVVFPTLGSVADLQPLAPVLAVGARTLAGVPSGFPGSVTADDQEVDLTGGTAMQGLIEVNASGQLPDAIAGGPLLDEQGQVVGVIVNVDPADSTDQQMTFAVPVDQAVALTQQLLNHLRPQHPWIGVTDAVDLPSVVAKQLGVTGGAWVGAVWPGSPAARIGIGANDVITSLNSQPVRSSGQLSQILTQLEPNEHVAITYLHRGRSQTTPERSLTTTIPIAQQPAAYNP